MVQIDQTAAGGSAASVVCSRLVDWEPLLVVPFVGVAVTGEVKIITRTFPAVMVEVMLRSGLEEIPREATAADMAQAGGMP